MSSYLKWATSLVSGGGPDICATIVDSSANGGADGSFRPSQRRLFGGWTLLDGVSKDDNKTSVSIFKFSSSPSDTSSLHAARNAVRRMKTLRHPDCLKYLDSCEVEEKKGGGGEVTLYVVTEKMTTLEDTLRELQQDENRNQYIAMGLKQITRAVSFLNNDAKIVHGIICMESIGVTDSLDWKLHAFDVLSEFDDSPSEVPVLPNEFLIPPQYKPVEVAKGDWLTVRKSPPWCIDAWGLGCLIYEIFSFTKLGKSEDLRNTGAIPELLLSDYQKLLAGAPRRRLNPSKLLENEYFSDKLLDAILFLESLSLKDSAEKDSFFRKLGRIVEEMPTNVAQRKVLPLLLNALEYGGAPPSALGPLLQIGKQLTDDDFTAKVLPCITRLFASTDRALRISLLQSISLLEPYLSAQLLNDQLFSNITAGFADSTAYLRELTLKSLIPLIPKLNSRNLNSELLKYLAKLQVDPEGVIRANTTICLGKIAPNLSDSARKRVLLNAFTRAMKDQFPPARCAGLLAIAATLKYYLPDELAMRAIPSVSASLVDQDPEVRQNAFKCIDAIVVRLKQHSEDLVKASASSNEDGKKATGNTGTSDESGIMSWAVGSISQRLGGVNLVDSSKQSNDKAKSPIAPAAQAKPSVEETSEKELHPAAAAAAGVPPSIARSGSNSRFSAVDDGWSDTDNPFDDDNNDNDGRNHKSIDDAEGWGMDDDDGDGWGDMSIDEAVVESSLPKKSITRSVPTDEATTTSDSVDVAAAARSNHVQIPKARSSLTKSSAAKKPMKLGAKPKLGATKLSND